jgi:hypothetical protein
MNAMQGKQNLLLLVSLDQQVFYLTIVPILQQPSV